MKKSIATVLAILIAVTAYAEGGPHFDKGEILLIGFIAVAAAVIAIGIVCAVFFFPLQFITEQKRYFWVMLLVNLVICFFILMLVFAKPEIFERNKIAAMVVTVILGSIISFFISPVKKK